MDKPSAGVEGGAGEWELEKYDKPTGRVLKEELSRRKKDREGEKV